MMDYYGSIVRDNSEIDRELTNYFKDKTDYNIPPDIFQGIIDDLRARDIIKPAYSVTGWGMYGGQEAIVNITAALEKRKENQRRLAFRRLVFMYCMRNNPLCLDIAQEIGEAM